MCDLDKLVQFAGGRVLTKVLVIEYMEWYDLKVKSFKVQKEAFMSENKKLSMEKYNR